MFLGGCPDDHALFTFAYDTVRGGWNIDFGGLCVARTDSAVVSLDRCTWGATADQYWWRPARPV